MLGITGTVSLNTSPLLPLSSGFLVANTRHFLVVLYGDKTQMLEGQPRG